MSGKPVLHYFNGRGKMECIRWLLATAGVEVGCAMFFCFWTSDPLQNLSLSWETPRQEKRVKCDLNGNCLVLKRRWIDLKQWNLTVLSMNNGFTIRSPLQGKKSQTFIWLIAYLRLIKLNTETWTQELDYWFLGDTNWLLHIYAMMLWF